MTDVDRQADERAPARNAQSSIRNPQSSDTRNLKLVLAYDGTDFHGWQRQAACRTVQAEVEGVLRRVLRQPVNANGASRTDAGVHARGQVVNVLSDARVPVQNIIPAIGYHLPPDVALLHASVVPPTFHASRHARGKLYRYRIFNTPRRPVALLRSRYAWHVWFPLDLERMRAGAARLVGTHDFAAFASQGSPRASTVRTIRRIGIRRRAEEVLIDVEGDGFLYNQVRNIVGTLFEVGRGHWAPERVGEALASRDRRQVGPTAPAHGLCLQWVRYEPMEHVTHEAH